MKHSTIKKGFIAGLCIFYLYVSQVSLAYQKSSAPTQTQVNAATDILPYTLDIEILCPKTNDINTTTTNDCFNNWNEETTIIGTVLTASFVVNEDEVPAYDDPNALSYFYKTFKPQKVGDESSPWRLVFSNDDDVNSDMQLVCPSLILPNPEYDLSCQSFSNTDLDHINEFKHAATVILCDANDEDTNTGSKCRLNCDNTSAGIPVIGKPYSSKGPCYTYFMLGYAGNGTVSDTPCKGNQQSSAVNAGTCTGNSPTEEDPNSNVELNLFFVDQEPCTYKTEVSEENVLTITYTINDTALFTKNNNMILSYIGYSTTNYITDIMQSDNVSDLTYNSLSNTAQEVTVTVSDTSTPFALQADVLSTGSIGSITIHDLNNSNSSPLATCKEE